MKTYLLIVNQGIQALSSLYKHWFGVLLMILTDAGFLFLWGLLQGLLGGEIYIQANKLGILIAQAMGNAKGLLGFMTAAVSPAAFLNTLLVISLILLLGTGAALLYILLQGTAWWLSWNISKVPTKRLIAFLLCFSRENLIWFTLFAAWHIANVWLSLRAKALEVIGQSSSPLINAGLLAAITTIAALAILTAGAGTARAAIRLLRQRLSSVAIMTALIIIVFLNWQFIVSAMHYTTSLVLSTGALLLITAWSRVFITTVAHHGRV